MNTFRLTGIILKRTSTSETDRIVTVFTRERGKLVLVAKGARKLTSSKLSSLEPGSEVSLYGVETKGLPLLTQARLLNYAHTTRTSLNSIKQLFQILEMVDQLTIEEDPHEEIYDQVAGLLYTLNTTGLTHSHVHDVFSSILSLLGFTDSLKAIPTSISDAIEEITARHLKSYDFLTLK